MNNASDRLVLALEEVRVEDQALVGGKAASLAQLEAAGWPVPPALVVTSAALAQHLEEAGLGGELSRLQQELQRPPGATLDLDRLDRAREALVAAELPRTVSEALARRLGPLGQQPVAVRSSGSKEDLAGASFAGLYTTVLGARGGPAIEAAVKACWASLWQQRVVDYARQQELGPEGLSMAVIIQRLVQADSAGVLFTVNPVTRTDMEALVEAVQGLGESLVSGRVNADRYLLDLRSGEVLSREIALQATRTTLGPEGAEEQPLDPAAGAAASLDDAGLLQLISIAREVQEHYGRPMDVEFAFDHEGLWLLQARPITTLTFTPDLGEWTTADFKDGGVSSDVCSQFMGSLYEYAFDGSMPEYLKSIRMLDQDHQGRWCKMFFSRPYWNLGETKRAVEQIPGYSEESFDADLGIEAKPGTPSRTTPVSARSILFALPVLLALKRGYKERLAIDERYVAAFEQRKQPFDLSAEQLGALEREAFTARYQELLERFYFETETTYFYTIYNTSNSKTDLKPVFDKVNRAVGGDLDYLKLLSGLKELSHVRVMKDMHRVIDALAAEGRPLDDGTVRAFAARWRHHSRKELDIRVPRWEDDLPHVERFLRQNLADHDADRDPEVLEQRQHALYLKELGRAERALRRRPLLRRSFRKKLALVRTYEWWREEMRDYSSYLYYLVRKWTVAAAARLTEEGALQEPEEIWHLRFQQVIAALTAEATAETTRERVRWGRWVLRSFRNFDNPNEIGSRYGFDVATSPVGGGDALVGTPCSVGQASGRARVARNLEEAAEIEPGEILVSVYTDPGWTPLFTRLAGVVTETGGILSHAAVISREYGIPAVLAVPDATRAIRTGDTVSIDGAAGTVQIVARAAVR